MPRFRPASFTDAGLARRGQACSQLFLSDRCFDATMSRLKRLFAGGSAGNRQLTALVAAVLLLLLAIEGATLLRLGSLLTVHAFVGILLIPIVALKLASTGWRMLRYYLGADEYTRHGPPHVVLRALVAPVIVLSTVVLFSTGVALLALGQTSGTVVGLHKASFVVLVRRHRHARARPRDKGSGLPAHSRPRDHAPPLARRHHRRRRDLARDRNTAGGRPTAGSRIRPDRSRRALASRAWFSDRLTRRRRASRPPAWSGPRASLDVDAELA